MLGNRAVQTSVTNPLLVSVIPNEYLIECEEGGVGMTIAPGKKDLNGFTGAHDRDVETDLTVLFKQYAATVFVSLMEEEEYVRFQIPLLFHHVCQRGVSVIHYPIRDVNVPNNMTKFMKFVDSLFFLVQTGERLIIHCKGGLGRTGLVAASLLVRMGHEPQQAVHIVRHVRPGTIQTYDQQRWVHSYARCFYRGSRR